MRATRTAMDNSAADDLDAALHEAGQVTQARGRAIALKIDGENLPLFIYPVAVASQASVAAILSHSPEVGLKVLVGDRISADARATLDEAGWSWLDRRGEISLRVNPRFFVRRSVAPITRSSPQVNGPVRSRAGIAYLAAALERPLDAQVLRATARRAGLSHVALSNAKAQLREANLIDSSGRAIEHVTFEALSESWVQEVVSLRAAPEAANSAVLGGNAEKPDEPGWALTDTLAAIAWGAAITVKSTYPPDFAVPTRQIFDRAIHVLGANNSFETPLATISISQIPFDADRRFRIAGVQHLLTHPLYIALAISRDRARGPEILAAWNPTKPEGFERTW